MFDNFFSAGQLLALRSARQRWERRERQALSEPQLESASSERDDFIERFASEPGLAEVCWAWDLYEMKVAREEIEEALAAETFGAENTIEQVAQRLRDTPAASTLREMLDRTQVDQLLFDAVKSRAQGISAQKCCEVLRRALSARA